MQEVVEQGTEARMEKEEIGNRVKGFMSAIDPWGLDLQREFDLVIKSDRNRLKKTIAFRYPTTRDHIIGARCVRYQH